jgi:hypothetical protein
MTTRTHEEQIDALMAGSGASISGKLAPFGQI